VKGLLVTRSIKPTRSGFGEWVLLGNHRARGDLAQGRQHVGKGTVGAIELVDPD
jgi:hypothetical protein